MHTYQIFHCAVVAVFILAGPTAGLAQFPDLWTKDSSNPISTDFGASTVLYHEGVYMGWGDAASGIVYGLSLDGRNWTPYPGNPVLLEGPEWYDVNAVESPSVVLVDGTYHMYYSCVAADEANRIAHATSPDGIVWTKDPANPVLDLGPPGSIDSGQLIHPWVIYEDPMFRIWYNAVLDAPGDNPQPIAYATSYDGISWARYPEPVLEQGEMGEWDGLGLIMMNVLQTQGTYYMFYTGAKGDGVGGHGPIQIGYATSADGITWAKRVPSEPVLTVGAMGEWDDYAVLAPNVLETEEGFTMWYGGSQDLEEFSWGLATAEAPTSPVSNFGPYYPLYEGASWAFQSVENPSNTYVETVCCPFDIDGQPALLYELEGNIELAFRKDGPTIVYYGYYDGGEFVDFQPDLVLDQFQDGSIIAYPCESPPCGQYELIRVWDQMDHPSLDMYDIDPSLDNLILLAHYSDGDPPNFQNEIVESNLPAGMPPPPGAVTDLEWRQRGVGVVAHIGVSASTGFLHEKYVLVEVSPVSDDFAGGQLLPRLNQNSPNPFNPTTIISFDLPQLGSVGLHVFDLSGHLVKELVGKEPLGPGHIEIVWDGRDAAGRPVASGTYFYRLEAGSFSETKRMVLVK